MLQIPSDLLWRTKVVIIWCEGYINRRMFRGNWKGKRDLWCWLAYRISDLVARPDQDPAKHLNGAFLFGT